MGITVPENFNRPYLASVADRILAALAHVELSLWIRDDVYIPLGGNRPGVPRRTRNALAATTTCGSRHGAAWNSGVGILPWIGLATATGLQRAFPKTTPGPGRVSPAGWRRTNFVSVGWLLFLDPIDKVVTIAKMLVIRWSHPILPRPDNRNFVTIHAGWTIQNMPLRNIWSDPCLQQCGGGPPDDRCRVGDNHRPIITITCLHHRWRLIGSERCWAKSRLVWTLRLQKLLGEDFVVLNFANRAEVDRLWICGGETLLRQDRPVIYVAEGNETVYANHPRTSFYRHMPFDGWLRSDYCRGLPRDAYPRRPR